MKRTLVLLALSVTTVSVAACSQSQPAREATSLPKPHATDAAKAPNVAAAKASGKVIETMNAAGYTYVHVDTGREKVWAAAPEVKVKVGDQVVIPEGTPMHNYHSKTLNRDFPVVYFVGSLLDGKGNALAGGAAMPAGHPPTAALSAAPEVDVTGVKKADGGMTIGEVHAGKATLPGKEVTFRGKVVKFNAQIMGKNWLHVRDGSGDAKARTNDLTVTTDVTVKVGDTVLVSGKVVVNQDFGSGYKYDVIIEDAKVTRE